MKIKNCLLMILFPIFMIFAFLPVSAAENTEETETDSTAKVETSIKDEEDAEVKETLQENKKGATTAEKEDLPQVSTEINSVARETKSKTVKTEKSAEPKYEKTESNEAKSEEKTSEPEKKDSNYVVEFTHNKLTYILPGDSSVKLSKILDKLEIKGSDITEVECSDTSLFSATKESGEWVINSHKAFHTDEHLYVTIDNTKYNIKVTDYTLPNNRWSWYNSAKTIAITSSRVSKSTPDVYGYYYYDTHTLKLLGASESALLDPSQLKDYSEKESPMWNMCGDINTSSGNYVLHVEMDDKITYIGKNFFWAVNRDSSTSSTKKAFTIHLPSSLTSIGNYAFQESGISKLYMPDNVSSIGTQAFQNCPQLTYILIPNTVSTINTGAFNNTPNNCHIYVGATCTNLNSACGNNVSTRFGNYSNQYFHWHGQKIGSTVYAFPKTASEPKGHAGNYNTSPNNSSRTQLEIVGYGAMTNYSYKTTSPSPIKSNTPQVTTVTFNNVFGDKLVNSYDRYISSIGSYVFFQCPNITSITVPSSGLTAIGNGAFEQCTRLSSIKPSNATSGPNTLPATISNNTLSESIFNKCSSLTSFTIPSNITTIGTGAFKTSGLTSITITPAVKTIGTSAFQDCSSITSLTIPTTINSSGIGENAFSGLANRADIYYNGTESAFEGKCVYPVVNTFGYEIEDTAANSYVYHFPCGGSLWYGVDGYNNKITITGSGAMTNYSAGGSPITAHYTSGKPFTTVDIQAGTSIGNYAFLNCVTLTTIYFPNSGLTTIGTSAFQGCSGITSLTIPTTISSSGLKANAFYGLANRADIYYNGTEDNFTAKCTTSVANVFGYDIESTAANSYIYHFPCGNSLWYGVDGANNKITITGSGAMTDYSAGGSPFTTHYASGKPFTTVDIQAGTTIGKCAFYGCVTLKSVSIPNTVTTIGIGAFQASALTTINIPSSVTTIKNSAFQSCSGITSLTIPTTNSLVLEPNAFIGLANRADIYYNGKEADFISKCTTSVETVFGSANPIESTAANSYIYHFPCGNSLWYGVDGANAKITITGSGAMTNYSASVVSPITAHYTNGKTFTTIDMQEGTSIGTYAFLNCATLTTVTVPSSGLTVVGNNAFDSCTSLTSIKPANATSGPNTLPATISNNILPEALFFRCSSLPSFTIPSNITTIDDYAFMQAGLTSVTIPSNVTTINSQAFYGDTSLTTITIPNTVTTIQAGAFQDCSNLAEVRFEGNDTTTPYSNNIQSIGQNAFAGLTTNADIWYKYGNKASLIAKCYDATTLDSSFGTGNKYIYHFSENAGGQCGPALYWEIWSIYQYVDGTNDVNTKEMDITGSGDFYTSYDSTNRPWTNNLDREDTITKVVITKTDASGADITNIGDAVFRAFNALTTVEMPNTITDIRHDAFWKCTALANITLPSSLQIIGPGAFNSCALTSISIPASVTQISDPSNNSKPEWGGFANCTSLASVTFEGTPSIQTIGIGAFYNCTSLTSINIPASVITIGNSAFRGDSALTTVTLPPKASTTLTTIGEQAFRQCTALTTIRPSDETSVNTFPAGVTTIGAVAFYEDSALTGISIPIGVTSIGDNAFQGCTGLTYITFQTPRTRALTIGGRAFYGCSNSSLTSITIPDGIMSIGDEAFRGCSNVANLYIDYDSTSNIKLTTIGQKTFATLKQGNFSSKTKGADIWFKYGNKTQLKSLIVDGNLSNGYAGSFGRWSEWCYVFHFIKSEGQCGNNLYWQVKYEYLDPFEATQESETANIINDTTSETQTMYVTGSGNFDTTYRDNNRPWINNKNASGTTSTGEDNEITKVVIDSGATDIGANVFQKLHALQSVTIPNTVSTINEYAFYRCENLNGVTLPNSLTEIKFCAFRDCTGLTSINIPKSLTSITGTDNNNISMGAFSSCTSLANITFESGRTQNLVLGAGAFYNTRAASITLPEKLTVIGPGAFQSNTNLTTISLPSTLTTIDNQAFYSDSALTSITIPDSVTTIGQKAFQSCTSLASIKPVSAATSNDPNTFPSGVTVLNTSVLQGCANLDSFTISTGVTSVGSNAFVGLGTDNSIIQVDITYGGKEAQLTAKCVGGTLTDSFGYEAVNNGKYAFHFTQDITYISDGSTVTGLTPANYETNSGTTLSLPTPPDSASPDTQTYRFGGWCTDAELTTTPITQMTPAKSGPYGDLTYYAKWTLTVRTITYTLNGGTFGGNTPVTEFTPESGETINLSIPTKTDYAFLGWHFEQDLSDDAIGSFVADSSHTQDVTVYADWYERENVSYWANSSQTLQSTTEYEIIKPWETKLQGGTGQSPKWYVLNSDVTFDKRLIVNGHVNLILQDGCKLKVNKGISVNNPNSITIYAQDSDYNYINQDLGNITRMNLKKIEYEYDYNRTTYGTDDYDDGPIVDLTTGKTYMRTALGEYVYNDESGTELIVDDNSWKEEGEEGSGVWYCIPEGETEKYYEGEEGGRSYIATAEGTQKYYLNNDYATKWSNALWTKNNDWNNLGDNQSYFFDTVSLKSYYYEDTDGDYYYETTDSERTHKYYNLGGGYFTDDWDAYSNHKKAGKIESNPSSEGAGIGGDKGNINGDITIYGGEYKLYGGYGNAGIGTGAFVSGSNANNHTITINGGTFDIDARIEGGTAIGGGSHANGGSIVINGGRLTLDCQEDGVACIGAGNGVETNTTQISLSWTNITDYIKIKKHNINYSTLTIDSNKPFVFVGEDIITDDSYATAGTITDKGNSEFTIIPYPNTSYVLTIPNRIVLPFKTLIYPFNPSVSVYTRPDDADTPSVDESTPLVKPYQIALNIDKTNFVKDGDATKTIVYDLVDKEKGGTSLVGENKYEYFSSDSYDYDNYRETHIGGAQDVWMSINSNVWENLSPGIYRATVTFNVGLATNGTSSGGGGPTYIGPGGGSMS